MLELFFWLNVLIVVYTYLGYGLILLVLNLLYFRKNNNKRSPSITKDWKTNVY